MQVLLGTFREGKKIGYDVSSLLLHGIILSIDHIQSL